jgi:hypothetical protein
MPYKKAGIELCSVFSKSIGLLVGLAPSIKLVVRTAKRRHDEAHARPLEAMAKRRPVFNGIDQSVVAMSTLSRAGFQALQPFPQVPALA